MTRQDAIHHLILFYTGYLTRPDPALLTAAKLGKEALEIVIAFQDCFPTLLIKLLPRETPQIDNKRSLHHIKQTLESNEVSK